MGSSEEMNKFLETYNLLRFNQIEMENMDRETTTNEVKSIILKLPTNRSPGPVFTGEFYQTFKEELI